MSPVHSFSNDGIRAWELLFSQVLLWPDWGSGPFFPIVATLATPAPGAEVKAIFEKAVARD